MRKTIDNEDHIINELTNFILTEYGIEVREVTPAERGFYGETWCVHTENGQYFLKIDYLKNRKNDYRNSLDVIEYMTDSGISFIPKIIKTKRETTYGEFNGGMAAVFEYVRGQHLEQCSIEQLFGRLSKIYKLKTDEISLKAENFGADTIDTFHILKNSDGLPREFLQFIDKKAFIISGYEERLRYFSAKCREDKYVFHITHGDAGGNCILNDGDIYIVDWDSVMLAPIERDAWVYMNDKRQLDIIYSVLAENHVDYIPCQNLLCYYCYYFFFYYLDEYLKMILCTENSEHKKETARNMSEYLEDSWIYRRLDIADKIK